MKGFFFDKFIKPTGGGQSWSAYWATREPTDVSATITGSTTATVTWTDSAELGADGYKVYAGATLKATVAVGLQTADVTGLTEGTEYVFKVVAYKGTEESTGDTDTKTTLIYLLQDLFTTADDAPVTTPRTCEPLGTLVIETPDNVNIASGVLNRTGTCTVRTNGTYARTGGLAAYCKLLINADAVANRPSIGFSANGSAAYDTIIAATNGVYVVSGTTGVYLTSAPLKNWYDTISELLVVQRPTQGALYFMRGITGKWLLLYASTTGSGANNYGVIIGGASDLGWVDNFEILRLANSFATDFGIAKYYDATPTTPELQDGGLWGMVEITWTPAESEVLELYGKYTDADNKIFVRCDQAASTCKLINEIAGVESELQSTAQTWTIGTPVRVLLRIYENYATTFINDAIEHTRTVTTNRLGKKWGASGFAAATNFTIWDGYFDMPEPYSDIGYNSILFVGDSKVQSKAMPQKLTSDIAVSTGNKWDFSIIGVSGDTLSAVTDVIDGYLLEDYGNPSIIIISLGTNDLSSLPAEATWKANYRTLIAALHTKYATANIYLCKPVRLAANPASSPVAATATMHGYIDDLIAEQIYIHEGFDETDLEGGDGYVTNFADYAHPTIAGYYAEAGLMKTILGL